VTTCAKRIGGQSLPATEPPLRLERLSDLFNVCDNHDYAPRGRTRRQRKLELMEDAARISKISGFVPKVGKVWERFNVGMRSWPAALTRPHLGLHIEQASAVSCGSRVANVWVACLAVAVHLCDTGRVQRKECPEVEHPGSGIANPSPNSTRCYAELAIFKINAGWYNRTTVITRWATPARPVERRTSPLTFAV
jgi:hypothetical protein